MDDSEDDPNERTLVIAGSRHTDKALRLGEALIVGLNLKSLVVFWDVEHDRYYFDHDDEAD